MSPSRARRPLAALAAGGLLSTSMTAALVLAPAPAHATDPVDALDDATALAAAIVDDPSLVTGAQPEKMLTALASTRPLAGFPKSGPTFGILSSVRRTASTRTASTTASTGAGRACAATRTST